MLCIGILRSGSRIARRMLGRRGGLCGMMGRWGGLCRGGLCYEGPLC